MLFSESLSTVTPDGIQSLSAPELRRRSAIIVNRLRDCIATCKNILVEKFQVRFLYGIIREKPVNNTNAANSLIKDTQCDAAGKLSQSIYIVESMLGKCHEEADLLFFTIRADSQVCVE